MVNKDLKINKIDAKFDKPNGLAFSPNGKYLYVADSGAANPGNFDLSSLTIFKYLNLMKMKTLSATKFLLKLMMVFLTA